MIIVVFDNPLVSVELFARGFLGAQAFRLGLFTRVRGFASRRQAGLGDWEAWNHCISPK